MFSISIDAMFQWFVLGTFNEMQPPYKRVGKSEKNLLSSKQNALALA